MDEKFKLEILIGTIPERIDDPNLPHLYNFPASVLFLNHTEDKGRPVLGSARYRPELLSYRNEADNASLKYHNVIGGKSWVTITYNSLTSKYSGEKFVNEELVGVENGLKWYEFFANFTRLGLSAGERCEFELADDEDALVPPTIPWPFIIKTTS